MPRSPSTTLLASIVIAPRDRHSPEADEKIAIDWCCRDASAQGQLTANSPIEEWQALARRCAQTPATLLLPADAVSHFHLAAPKGLKRSEWPLLLEEVTSDDSQTLHLHALQRGRGHLELVALSADALNRWQTWAHHLELTLAGWSVGFMALALPAQDDEATTLDDGEHRLFKGYGEPVTAGGAAVVQWLAWPRDWPAPPAWRERCWQEPVPHDASSSAEAVRSHSLAWVAAQHPTPLPFGGSATSGAANPRADRLAALLPARCARLTVVALLVLASLNVALWVTAQMTEHNRQAQHRQAALAARFDGEPPPAALAQLADRRDAIDALAQRNRRLQATVTRATALLEGTQWQLSRQMVNGQQVLLGWRPPGPPAPVEIAQASQRLSPLGDPQWQAAKNELTLSLTHDSLTLASLAVD